MQQRDKRFIFLLVFMLLGVLISLQFRTTLNANRQKTRSELNIENLKTQLSEEMNIKNSLKKSIDENEAKKEAYLKLNIENRNDEYLKQVKKSLDDARMKAGLVDVKGPGIIIKLDDAPARVANVDPRDIIIHDIDVVKVLNKLKAAGAQAISINDERIISTSEQICAGPTIRINKNRYAVPYEIKAIGDPDTLYEEISKSEIVAILQEFKIRVEITTSDNIIIPKFKGTLDNLVSALEVAEK